MTANRPGREVIRGTKGRIGFLWPADGLNDDEYWHYLPDGVALLTARYPVSGGLSLAELESDADQAPISAAARLLEAARVDVLALGDCAASFVLGAERERSLIGALVQQSRRPATAMSMAIVAALRALRARSIGLVAPYEAAVVSRFVTYFETAGIEVVRQKALSFSDEAGIERLTSRDWAGLATSVDHPEADAIVLGGGGLRAAASLAATEAQLGKPVVAGPAALIWHACRLIDVDATKSDLGQLYARLGAAEIGP